MKPILKLLKVSDNDYLKTHLTILNSILPTKLTDKEIEVLSEFMALEGTLAKDRFCTSGKKIVRLTLKLSSQGLYGHIKTLKEKGFITEDDKIISILFPSSQEEQTYQFKLIKE